MQFSTEKLSKRDYFFSQPHQPFFTLGIINAIISMLLFIPAYKGIFGIDAKFFHSYSMIFLVFTNFFLGFLYTTFPRFSGTFPIHPRKYLMVFLFNLLATVSFFVSIWLNLAFFAAAIFMAISFALTLKEFYSIYKVCTLPKNDQYWLIVAIGVGAISNIFFLLSYIPCSCKSNIIYDTAINFGIYLYLIFLAFVVAFRMVPFFSHVMNWEKNRYLHIEIFTLFLLHSFLYNLYPKALFLIDLIAAILIANELKKIKLPFPNKEPLLWILHISIFWLPAALFIGSLIEFFEKFYGIYSFQLPIHLLALGFLTTILIGFGTRVTLGHSGNMLIVDRVTVYIFYFTQIVILGRVIFSIMAYFGKISPFFDISATLWIVLFVWWMLKYFKVLAFGEKIA
ncbi:NnrS family protein [Nitrosophilus kaiyonis]|uniref:NnrS family protein n=1 Tax=Nitrosophilus kaiyonis TaxID=2930200 RepID=UPI0024904A7A|nr:NnrS family protein [Nitrosophilus kaiyonis]